MKLMSLRSDSHQIQKSHNLKGETKFTYIAEFPKARRHGYVGASAELRKLRSSKQKTTGEEKNGQEVQAEDVAEERYDAAPRIGFHHAVNSNLLISVKRDLQTSIQTSLGFSQIFTNVSDSDQSCITRNPKTRPHDQK
jgi:hypothetical protein